VPRCHIRLIAVPFLAVVLACGASSLLPLLDSCCAPAYAQEASFRDWQKRPAILALDMPDDVYAVGDVHGDYERLVHLLANGQLIAEEPPKPKEVTWTGGKAVLICTGDLIDKGKHSLKVIALFRALQAAADRDGGRVIVTMGNHEAEFLAYGSQDDKADRFLKELDESGIDADEVAKGRDADGIGAWMRDLPLAARVGDWFFVHAGNPKALTVRQLAAELREGIDARGYRAPDLLCDSSCLEARLHPQPWWEHDGDDEEKSREHLRQSVEALGCRHLVIGHQPGKVKVAGRKVRGKGEVCQLFDGLIFLIDGGMSEAIDYSQGTLLHIHHGGTRVTALDHDGKHAWKWPE
jgi:hypothetical protein